MIRAKASLTVEAVFVLPIVIFTMVFIIYLSFYLYDYCIIRGITDGVLHKAAMNIKHEADIESGSVNYDEINKGLFSRIFEESDSKEKEIEACINKLLSKGLIATRVTDVKVTKKAFSITVRVEGSFMFPFKGLLWIIPLDNTLLVEAKSTLHHPADTVRMSEVILDTGSRIEGLDKIKKGIGSLIP